MNKPKEWCARRDFFNADKTMAAVYMSHVCSTGDGCADGKSFLLQKHNGK